MPRKAFLADLASAAARGFQGVTRISRGDEDGEIDLRFELSQSSAVGIRIIATGK